MNKLAIINDDDPENIKVIKILANGGVEFWERNMVVASGAIAYQQNQTEIERFNQLHLNLLLTQLIEKKVIGNNFINLDQFLLPLVEKETARTAWRWSKKRKLINFFEHEYQKGKGKFTKTVWTRLKADGIKGTWEWLNQKLPQPIKNIIDYFKELDKKINGTS